MESIKHLPETLCNATSVADVLQPPTAVARTTPPAGQQPLAKRFEIIIVNNEFSFRQCRSDSTPPVSFEIGAHPSLQHSVSTALHGVLQKTLTNWLEFLTTEVPANGCNNIAAMSNILGRLGIVFVSETVRYNNADGKELAVLQERTGRFVVHIDLWYKQSGQSPKGNVHHRKHFYIFFDGQVLLLWNGIKYLKYKVQEVDRQTKQAARAVFELFFSERTQKRVMVNNIFRVSRSLE